MIAGMGPDKLLLGCLAVAGGSAVGGCARWALALWLNARHAHFLWGTFVANALGGLLVGLALAYLARHAELAPEWRLFIVTGFLGGLTTFSTYSAEVVVLLERGDFAWALTVAAAHLAASLTLTAFGFWLYRQWGA
jgi:fluoride exporter